MVVVMPVGGGFSIDRGGGGVGSSLTGCGGWVSSMLGAWWAPPVGWCSES